MTYWDKMERYYAGIQARRDHDRVESRAGVSADSFSCTQVWTVLEDVFPSGGFPGGAPTAWCCA